MQLTRLMVPNSKYNIKCPYAMNPDGICVHNTANKASAMSEISYMVGNNNQVSYHYAVDDYRIVQGIEENRNAWHAGDGGNGKGNRNKIAIEICHSTNPDTSMFDKSERLAAKFIAYKLKEKGWGIEKVSKHQDYNGKYCPHKTLDLGWERFLNLIRAELGQENKTTVPTNSNSNSYLVRVTATALNIRSGAGTNHSIVGCIRDKGTYTIVETQGNWGKLKSGAGWICLDYTQKAGTANTAKPATSTSFSKGQKVTLKASASKYCTGQTIPSSIKGKSYTIMQVGSGNTHPDGVLLKEIMSWVYKKDVQ